MHGHLLVAIETMRRHHQAVFVPVVIVRVLAVDVRTGRLTKLLTMTTPTNGAGIPRSLAGDEPGHGRVPLRAWATAPLAGTSSDNRTVS